MRPPNKLCWLLTIATCLLIGELIAVGWLNFILARRDNQVHALLEMQWDKVRLSNEAMRHSVRNNRITMEVFFLKDPKEIAALLTERGKNTDRITELLDQLQKKADSRQEDNLIKAIWTTRIPYVDSYKEALALLLDRRKYDEARLKMVRVTLPNLRVYHEAWETFVQFQWEQMNAAGRDAQTHSSSARRAISWLLGLTALTAGVECFFILRWSRKPDTRAQRSRVAGKSLENAESAVRG
jgi:hypothetical protein